MYIVDDLEVNWRALALCILSPQEIPAEKALEYFYSDRYVPLKDIRVNIISEEDVLEMVSLHGDLTYRQIAEEFTMTKNEVYYRIRKYRRETKKKSHSGEVACR